MPEVSDELRWEIRERANHRCEYCLVPERVSLVEHQVDHIIAVKHGGETSTENLALCCTLCNRYKGSDIASSDPETSRVEPLFHPRRDQWRRHFELRGAEIVPRTVVGRVSIRLLQLNRPERVKERELMLAVKLLEPG
jgi:hypothetical protein